MAAFSHHHHQQQQYYSSSSSHDPAFIPTISMNKIPTGFLDQEDHMMNACCNFHMDHDQFKQDHLLAPSVPLQSIILDPDASSSSSALENGADHHQIIQVMKKAKKQIKKKEGSSLDPSKDYIHVRARRGQATDAHSLAERVRREKISRRMKQLQTLVPGCDKVTGKATMLEEIINYIQSLQNQVEFLSMKLASYNPMFYDLDPFMVAPHEGMISGLMPNAQQYCDFNPSTFDDWMGNIHVYDPKGNIHAYDSNYP